MERKFIKKYGDSEIYAASAYNTYIASAPVYLEEDDLYTETSRVESEKAEINIELTSQFFRIGTSPIDSFVMNMKHSELEKLRTAEAVKIPHNQGFSYVTGIKMIYAVKQSNFCLYFSPVKFSRDPKINPSIGNGLTINYTYDIVDSGKIFKYENDAFIQITDADELVEINRQIQDYVRPGVGISLKPNRWEPSYRNHNQLPTIEGDTTSVILPFQTFEKFKLSNNLKDTFKLWNQVKDSVYNGKSYIKHDLIFSSDDIFSDKGDIIAPTFGGKFANLSHLCPPSCQGLKAILRVHKI